MSALDEKFKVLLDPIKDLAASWDIDIADSLTEYLEELDGIDLTSVEGGKGGINFATAAMLIQGSTAVYSKKVEFLHQLVLQALDLISTKKSAQNSKENGSKKNKVTANTSYDEERLLFGSDPSYLLLDDVVEEGSNINLIDNEIVVNEKGKDRRRSSKGRHSVTGDFTHASIVLMHSVLQEDHGGSNLRMSSCVMDTSGALLMGGLLPERTSVLSSSSRLPLGPLGVLGQASMGQAHAQGPGLPSTIMSASAIRLVNPAVGFLTGEGSGANMPGDGLGHGMDMGEGEGGWNHDDGGDDQDNDYGGNDDGGYYPDGGNDDVEDPLQMGHHAHGQGLDRRRSDVSRLGMDEVDDAANGGASIGTNLFNNNNNNNATKTTNKKPPKIHTLTLFDPHEAVLGSRPLKKGRPHKIPPPDFNALSKTTIDAALSSRDEQLINECLQNIATMGIPLSLPLDDDAYLFRNTTATIAGVVNTWIAPPVPSLKHNKGTAAASSSAGNGTTEAAAAAERESSHGRNAGFFLYKDALTAAAEEQGQGLAPGGGSDGMEGSDGVYMGGDDAIYDDDDDGGFWGDDHDNDYGGGGAGVVPSQPGNDPSADIDDARPLHLRHSHATSVHGEMGGGILDIFQDIDADMAQRVEDALNEGLSQSQGHTYETICRQHIDNFMKGAEQYARETQLSKRVAEWTYRLEPMLRAQEASPEFDIHTYSDMVLSEMDGVLRMDPSRRLSEIGLGQAFFNDTTEDSDTENDRLHEVENHDENVRNRGDNDDDEQGQGALKGKGKGRGSDATNKRVSISLACLEALQQALTKDTTVVDFAEIVHATVHKTMMMMRGWGPGTEQGGETWAEGSSSGGRTSGGGGGGEVLEQQRLYAAAEVCRVFLACLMLANTGNLDVIPPDDNHDYDYVKDDGMRGYGAFAVRMLETTRKKNMDDFLAPSIAEEHDHQKQTEKGRKTGMVGSKKSKKTARSF